MADSTYKDHTLVFVCLWLAVIISTAQYAPFQLIIDGTNADLMPAVSSTRCSILMIRSHPRVFECRAVSTSWRLVRLGAAVPNPDYEPLAKR